MKKKAAKFEFGAEVRRRREARRYTLDMLGERSGLTPNYIGGVELGHRDPSLSTIFALAKGFGVPVGELFWSSTDVSPAGQEAGHLFEALSTESRAAVLKLLYLLVPPDSTQHRRRRV